MKAIGVRCAIAFLGLGILASALRAQTQAAAPAQAPATADAKALPNYRLIRPDLAAAGQPSAEGLAQLKQLGFKTVINLRTEREGAKDEEAAVKAAGLDYVWVPVTPETLSHADVDAVSKVLANPAAGPVLLHCASANRVGAIWALIRRRQGATLEEAESEGKAVGLVSPALVEVVRKLGAEKP
ncbi:MAG TPA: protein tyrosine phosphatase family protein [Vicinamibacteria bacterium]|nr:protein tyrosine phosphatase family protein [Vicinamibacteria bacterium]